MATKRFVSKDNLGRVWARLFGKVLNSKEEIEANTSENMIAGADAVKEVYSSFGTLSFGVGSDGKAYYKIGGADTEYPFNSGANGILTIGYAFSMTMSTHDGGVGSGSGKITVTITDGTITNYTMTGSGTAITVGGQSNTYGCSASNFRITGISWTPQ